MDFDICLVCHSRIDYSKLDAAYPHLTESSDYFPPAGMSPLEESIYWGTICADCARSAEAEAPGQELPQGPPPATVQHPGAAAFPSAATYPAH